MSLHKKKASRLNKPTTFIVHWLNWIFTQNLKHNLTTLITQIILFIHTYFRLNLKYHY